MFDAASALAERLRDRQSRRARHDQNTNEGVPRVAGRWPGCAGGASASARSDSGGRNQTRSLLEHVAGCAAPGSCESCASRPPESDPAEVPRQRDRSRRAPRTPRPPACARAISRALSIHPAPCKHSRSTAPVSHCRHRCDQAMPEAIRPATGRLRAQPRCAAAPHASDSARRGSPARARARSTDALHDVPSQSPVRLRWTQLRWRPRRR